MEPGTILVTGAGGFAGQYLLRALRVKFPSMRLTGTGSGPDTDEVLDITNRDAVGALFRRIQPAFCVHLAAIAAIGAAKADPDRAWAVNLHGTLNIARAIMTEAPQCRMIFVSSAECYGESFKPGLALDETATLAPLNLYAATKAATEMALNALAGEGLRLMRLRPFNHTGPGQRDSYVVPDFAGQIARIEAGLAPAFISVGSLEPERDFMDVRDVCEAYVLAVERFDKIPNNEIINIASGQPIKIAALLDSLLNMARCKITIRQDPTRLRPVEIARAAGNPARALTFLNWAPRLNLHDTLRGVLDYARKTQGPAATKR